MKQLDRRSNRVQKLIFILILTVSLFFNALYFFGIIETKMRTTKEIEFMDSPLDLPVDRINNP